MSALSLELMTPMGKVFEGNVKLVQAPGALGLFTILHNHAPLISTLQKGKVKIVTAENKEQFYEINSGVLEVVNNKVVLLAESIKQD